MHQIRVHAAHMGHPIAGDERYGDDAFNSALSSRGLRRIFLHAHAVGFAWPDSGDELMVSAPLPEELRQVQRVFETRGSKPGREASEPARSSAAREAPSGRWSGSP